MDRFLADAVEFLQRLGRGLMSCRDDRAVDLAAHMFAVAYRIPREGGTAPLAVRPETLRPLPTVEDLAAALSALPPSVDGPTLYWTLVGGLQTLDREWRRVPFAREAFRPATRLQGHGDCDLTGEVVHWLRPTPALRSLRRHRSAGAGGHLPTVPAHHPADELDQLGMFWNVNQNWPRVVVRPPPQLHVPLIVGSGEAAAGRHRFRVALCPLVAESFPRFRVTADGAQFRALDASSLDGREALAPHLEEVLRSAVEGEVHLLVLPELMVDAGVRGQLTGFLKEPRRSRRLPIGVVSGSYHIWRDGHDPEAHAPANESRLLDQAARSLLRHEKRGKFRVTPRQVQAFPQMFVERPDRFPAEVREVVEGIVHGPTLEILETALGRVVIAICADCIAPDQTNLEPLFRELRPDLLIIVSMTPETDLFEALVGRLASIGTSSLFVNARCVCRPEDRPLLASAQLALHEPQGAPPTRCRWRCGEDQPEVRYYRPADGEKGWRPLSQALGDSGVSWLGSPARRLGVVVDLGCHWRWSAERGRLDEE